MELCLYNAVLTGMSQDGKAFTYVNQLASSPEHLSNREEWFDCACCPPNILRLLGSIGGYLWSHDVTSSTSASVAVHLYTSAKISFEINGIPVILSQETDWPQDGHVKLSLSTRASVHVTLHLRIPGWADLWEVSLTLIHP
jgi:DUF1680 family protein